MIIKQMESQNRRSPAKIEIKTANGSGEDSFEKTLLSAPVRRKPAIAPVLRIETRITFFFTFFFPVTVADQLSYGGERKSNQLAGDRPTRSASPCALLKRAPGLDSCMLAL